jgi:hypothetical protein
MQGDKPMEKLRTRKVEELEIKEQEYSLDGTQLCSCFLLCKKVNGVQ